SLFAPDAATATVTGIGAVTIGRRGRSTRFEAGSVVGIDQLGEPFRGPKPVPEAVSGPQNADDAAAGSPFLEGVIATQHQFDEALASGDARAAVKAVLELDDLFQAWANESFGTDEPDRARAALRAMVT